MPGEGPKEKHEAKLEFKLFPVGSTSPQLASSASGKTGGMNIKSAMSIAGGVGSMASMAMMAKGFGFDPRLMNMFSSMNAYGYGSPMGGFDPAMTTMTSLMNRAAPATPTNPVQLDAGESEAIGQALQNAAKAVASNLKKKK